MRYFLRERERERHTHTHTYTYIYIYIISENSVIPPNPVGISKGINGYIGGNSGFRDISLMTEKEMEENTERETETLGPMKRVIGCRNLCGFRV